MLKLNQVFLQELLIGQPLTISFSSFVFLNIFIQRFSNLLNFFLMNHFLLFVELIPEPSSISYLFIDFFRRPS